MGFYPGIPLALYHQSVPFKVPKVEEGGAAVCL
jgi:hypothetical protein